MPLRYGTDSSFLSIVSIISLYGCTTVAHSSVKKHWFLKNNTLEHYARIFYEHLCTIFTFLKPAKLFTDDFTFILSHQQSMRIPVALHSCHHLSLSAVFFLLFLLVILSCEVASHYCFTFHLVMADDVKHLLMCLFAICRSPVIKCLFKSHAYLKNLTVCFLLIAFWQFFNLVLV